MLQRLPLGTSAFAGLRTLNYVYVDKTEYIYNLIQPEKQRFFLSRPRRFGKSLLVSTLKEVLSGNKDLFDSLWIAQSKYQWPKHGVIKLDFSELSSQNPDEFKYGLIDIFLEIGNQHGIIINISSGVVNAIFKQLVLALHAKFGRVAILIDEYDRPILHNLQNVEGALAMRSLIQDFFTAVKARDEYINFVFITGVSSFAKAGLFSGINNLKVISLNDKFSGICGYTDQEVDHYFTGHIQAWADSKSLAYSEVRSSTKNWYNGYRFGTDVPSVYNPFSLMNALDDQQFENFWFESGMPTFLVDELKKEYRKDRYHLFSTDNLEVTKESLGIFDIDSTPLTSLMFQTGYLTIAGYNSESNRYMLDYPNFEVKQSLQKYLFEVFAHLNAAQVAQLSGDLRAALNRQDLDAVIVLLKQLFAHIPYQLHIKEEKFYHALLQMICTTSGIKAQSEYSTDHGRIDLVLDLPNLLYVVEIKFNTTAEEALAQIEQRRYYDRFVHDGKSIILLGLAFNRQPGQFDVTYAAKKLA